MIFLAVGTQFGFDRLVKAVDEILENQDVDNKIFAQIGPGKYQPKNMEHVVSLEKDRFDAIINTCDAMISHAGIGNISLAIKFQKPLLVLPRLKKYREVVNDHQVDTAQKFEALGHILAAYNTDELADKIKQLKTFVPKSRVPNRQGVVDRITHFIQPV